MKAGESTYEEKKKQFKDNIIKPYRTTCCQRFSDVICRSRPNKFFDFSEPEADKTADSLRKLSYKVIIKESLVHKIEQKKIYRISQKLQSHIGQINLTTHSDSIGNNSGFYNLKRLHDTTVSSSNFDSMV